VDLPVVTALAVGVRLTDRGFDSARAAEVACAPLGRAALTETEILGQVGAVVELLAWLRDLDRDWESVDDVVELLVHLSTAEALLTLARAGVGARLAGLYADEDGAS
jgi:hypothetical protein